MENTGMYNNTSKPTANKQVEMFFKLTCNVDVSGDVLLRRLAMSRRAFLEIMNNLQLKNTNGGNTITKNIIKTALTEITQSFTQSMAMMVVKKNSTARSVNSLRLVSDVR